MKRKSRRGLSTLELVLCLPILLCVMGLIINYGTAASWKIRGLSLARHELWSHREGRAGYPQKQYWPQYHPALPEGVTAGGGGSGPDANLDDPRVDHPVMRGPTVGDAPPPARSFYVDRDMFDPTRGMRRGSSDITRTFPLLKRLGQYALPSKTEALDGRWQFESVGLPCSRDRRIPLIYTLPRTAADLGLAMQYVQAVAQIWYSRFQNDLWPLDKDDEFIYWGSRFEAQGIRGWSRHPPDFYRYFAWLSEFCEVDDVATRKRVDDLVNRIQGKQDNNAVPPVNIPSIADNMTQAFINFFERVIDELERQLKAVPPPTNADQMRQEIDALKGEIDLLRNKS